MRGCVRKIVVAAMFGFVLISQALPGQQAAKPLASKAEYAKFIDPLVAATDLHTVYVNDGAADASVLWPSDNKPAASVLAIVLSGQKSVPLLIDCLHDLRVTKVVFDGAQFREPEPVPVGFVCLDILMGTTLGGVTNIKDCADDGLGACTEPGYYFRPDDYEYPCRLGYGICMSRPWVQVVQKNWRRAYLRGQIKFKNPYPPGME